MLILWIAIFGAFGTVARYGVSRLVPAMGGFPFATLSVNLLGSLLIGLLAGPSIAQGAPLSGRILIPVVGFLGGFTTFSAFSLETVRLAAEGKTTMALVYGFGSPVLCVALAAVGVALATAR